MAAPTTKFTNETLRAAMELWCSDRAAALAKYGPIGEWGTSGVTDMSRLFQNNGFFNDDISGWDVSKVESMESMFHNASKFNQSLGAWKLSPQICSDSSRTYRMFVGADAFSSEKPKGLSVARRAARARAT